MTSTDNIDMNIKVLRPYRTERNKYSQTVFGENLKKESQVLGDGFGRGVLVRQLFGCDTGKIFIVCFFFCDVCLLSK